MPGQRSPIPALTSALFLAAIAGCPQHTGHAAVTTEGLVGWWRFDGATDGAVEELSGGGGPAQLLAACREGLSPEQGMRIPHRPVEGHAIARDHPLLRGQPTRLTVCAWVWWDGRGGGAAVSCPNRFVLGPRVWEVHYETKSQEGWQAILESRTPPSRRWMHLAGVLDAEGITFYRDGRRLASKGLPRPVVAGVADLHIGRAFGVAKWQMPGWLWEVRLYDRALTAHEISGLASVRRAAVPEDLPDTGLYLPGRTGQVPVPFGRPDCAPFVARPGRELVLSDADAAGLSMGGCGLYQRVDPRAWRGNGRLSVSGTASASRPVQAAIAFVGWPSAAELKAAVLFTRVCGEPIELSAEPTDLRAVVPVPRSTESGVVVLTVTDLGDDSADLVGTKVILHRLDVSPGGGRLDPSARPAPEGVRGPRSNDGLSLTFQRGGGVAVTKAGCSGLAGSGLLPAGGWFLSDLAADGLPVPLRGAVTEVPGRTVLAGTSRKLEVAYEMETLGSGGYLDCRARLRDLSGRDRSLLLQFRLPLASGQPWRWHDGQYESQDVLPNGRYEADAAALTPGGQRNVSGRPFAALSRDDTGLCIGVPLRREPRMFRLFAYRPFIGDTILGCEFEAGLAAVTERFPGRASYRFVVYATPPSWAFRRAAAKYYEFFPKQFTTAVKRHGNWAVLRMTQQYTPNMADFAIAADETVMGSPPADMCGSVANKLLGIPTCPYLRPGTYSQQFEGSPSAAGAYQARMGLLAEQEKLPEHAFMFPNPYWGSPLPVLARAAANSVLHDRDGLAIWRYNVVRRPGRFFSRCQLNCSYAIPTPNWAQVITRQYTLADDWARTAGAPLGGVYFDNICSVSINAFDFRRDHWALARAPLVVNADPVQPAQSKVLQLCEFFTEFADEVHRRGGFLIGNFIGNADGYVLAQFFDFIGYEGYNGKAIEQLRTMAGPKPVSYLPVAPVTRGMFENCLSYGVAPGFGRPSDRRLYQEFMPLIVSLSEAGWQPVPQAVYSADAAVVERFGAFGDGDLSFTVRRLAGDVPDGVLRIIARDAGVPDRGIIVMDMRGGTQIACSREQERLAVPLPLRAGRTEVIRVCRAAAWRRERVMRLARVLERAAREWDWVKAQHDDSLTARLGFEEDAGRWFRDGFEEAEVGPSSDAHSGTSALLIRSRAATDGTVKTEPFSAREGVRYRLAFHWRAEGTGEVTAKAVFRPSWFGGDPVGEAPLGGLTLGSGRPWQWQELEARVRPVPGGVRMYLQVDFAAFAGRFSMDSVTLCPCFEPLPAVPEFGFARLSGRAESTAATLEPERVAALVQAVQSRLGGWRSSARRLSPDDAERMLSEIAGIDRSLQRIGP